MAEEDHHGDAAELEEERGEADVLEAAGPADQEADDGAPEAGDDAVDGGDVAGVVDGQVVHDLEVGVEGGVPAVEGDEEEHGGEAGADDGAIGEEVVGDEVVLGPVFLVEREDDEAGGADDDHGDDHWAAVA